jgi:hypothetical protein
MLVAMLAAVALGACGDDDEGAEGEGPKGLTIEASEPAAGKFELRLPKEIEAGVVKIELRNQGKGTHDAQLIRAEGDHSIDEATQVLAGTGQGKPLPDWFRAAGGPGTTKPGATRSVTQVLAPGRYFVFDTEGDEGPPNFQRGGRAQFEVTGEPGGELPASAGPRIRAQDYSFESFDLKPGRSEVVFENAGKQPHHVVAAPIAEGSTIEDVKRFLQQEGEPEGPPPIDEEASETTSVIDGGVTQISELDLRPGNYALLCFISDREGGPEHVAKGMITEATVR